MFKIVDQFTCDITRRPIPVAQAILYWEETGSGQYKNNSLKVIGKPLPPSGPCQTIDLVTFDGTEGFLYLQAVATRNGWQMEDLLEIQKRIYCRLGKLLSGTKVSYEDVRPHLPDAIENGLIEYDDGRYLNLDDLRAVWCWANDKK